MTNPYAQLEDRAFWRKAVQGRPAGAMGNIHQPKFPIPRDAVIATAGSCFAQHVGRTLRHSRLNVADAEPAPAMLPPELAQRYGLGMYSGRYGNVYTARQMVELLKDCQTPQLHPDLAWPHEDRFIDALRPNVEPEGFASVDEVLTHRRAHLAALAAMWPKITHFVFTLGLTEAWLDLPTGRTLPTAPGVLGGAYDPSRHRFHNFRVAEIIADLEAMRAALHEFAPQARIVLTVSPVPLTATASGDHVLEATLRSKATLRVAAEEMRLTYDDVDYFPAYEIVTNPAARSRFYAENLREVTPHAVYAVMSAFARAYDLSPPPKPGSRTATASRPDAPRVVCEEMLLDALRP